MIARNPYRNTNTELQFADVDNILKMEVPQFLLIRRPVLGVPKISSIIVSSEATPTRTSKIGMVTGFKFYKMLTSILIRKLFLSLKRQPRYLCDVGKIELFQNPRNR